VKTLFIIGAGGLGREIVSVAQLMGVWEEIYFIDDNMLINSEVNDILVIGGIDKLMTISGEVFIAIGNQNFRKTIVEKLTSNPNLSFPNIIHPNVSWLKSKFNKIGIGNYLGDGVIGTVNIKIGNFNLINLGCALSHDTDIESFCNIMHGVKITSGALISNFVNIGAGACIISKVILQPNQKIRPNLVYNE
jgi:sugar O-acyltransferase (sialic acid O-acetyltransferase NeuD family)